MRNRLIPLCAMLCALHAMPLAAQSDGAPDPANVRVRLGPLLLNPTLALTNAGVDENVFNDPTSTVPKKDFTLTVTPSTDLWLPIGPTWVVGNIKEDINWFRQYASERSANSTYTGGWRVPLSRLALKVNATYSKARERPGFEIDARALRTFVGYDGAVEFRTLSRTYVGVTAQRGRTEFAEGTTFRGSNLHDELNRASTTYGLTVREQITTLTSITFAATRTEDRFQFSRLRDSNSSSLTATIALDPAALIKGSASIGYTSFEPQAGLETFTGLTSQVNLAYTLLGATRFEFTANRGIQYSFDVDQPYYLQTGFTGSIAQQVFGPVDVVGRAGRQGLAYRDRAGAVIEAPNRLDHVVTYGGGVGYHLGKSLRLGFNVDHSRRTSVISDRTYQGLRYGTALTYGT
jgi:putative beta-barrel porin BBP2